MSHEDTTCLDVNLVEVLEDFIATSNGLEFRVTDKQIVILQTEDQKEMNFPEENMKDIFLRKDRDGKSFLQLNFLSGEKVLVTESLIGFKPIMEEGNDYGKLPNVVTTPDLLSVFEAVEECLRFKDNFDELGMLRNVYNAILLGAEKIGINMTEEKEWIKRLCVSTDQVA